MLDTDYENTLSFMVLMSWAFWGYRTVCMPAMHATVPN